MNLFCSFSLNSLSRPNGSWINTRLSLINKIGWYVVALINLFYAIASRNNSPCVRDKATDHLWQSCSNANQYTCSDALLSCLWFVAGLQTVYQLCLKVNVLWEGRDCFIYTSMFIWVGPGVSRTADRFRITDILYIFRF